jgi:uncharacterized membrane protein YozB (DUF420 family)
MNGFLGTGATLAADVNLTIQLLMGIALLIGVMLARWRRYRAHGVCQASVILLNLVMIALIMLPPFRLEVVPELPGGVSKSYYSVATLHAALGGITELLGLYIVLRAGTNLLPKVLRFNNYKLWMRSALVLWWTVIIIGVSTYYIWYIASVPETTAREVQTIPIRPKEAAVTIVNCEFQPKDLTVEVGTKLTWTNHGSRHGVTADDGSFAATLI